jgi:putative ABC transport system substrate-binding protein
VARAQQTERVRRIGVLTFSAENDQEGQSSVAAFWEGLRKLGWMEGRNSEIDIRWAAADVGPCNPGAANPSSKGHLPVTTSGTTSTATFAGQEP